MDETVIIEGITIALAVADEALDLTLYADQTIRLDVEDAKGGEAKLRLDLTEIRALHEALGHLLWVADN